MDDGTTELDYPCCVVGIIPMEANGLEETELMVQACLDRTQVHQDRDSVLFQEWEIDHDTYYFTPASSIVKPAFAIGDLSDAVPDKKRVPKPTKRKRSKGHSTVKECNCLSCERHLSMGQSLRYLYLPQGRIVVHSLDDSSSSLMW